MAGPNLPDTPKSLSQEALERFKESLSPHLPTQQWLVGDSVGEEYSQDLTEEPPRNPAMVVWPLSTEEVSAVVQAANDHGVSLTIRVAGTNIGGLSIPPEGGVVLDLSRMNRILEVQETEMYAVVEPGVTWEQLKERLDGGETQLRVGYPLSPPESSVMANCLLDGLGSLSLPHGSMGEWIGGLEVVLPQGAVARVGAPALSDVWFGRSPLPGLTDLFVNWQSTTGIVTKMAVQLWPNPPVSRRMFVLCYDRNGAYSAMRELSKLGIADDIGTLSWTTGKLLYGMERPLVRGEDDPEVFLYIELTAQDEREMDLKSELFLTVLKRLSLQGFQHEDPFDLDTLVALNPEFETLAEFPTRLDFLLNHPGGGLSWVGTYGPMSRFEAFADRALALMERYSIPPTVVSRPMKGGHYGVLRFISVFNSHDEEERLKVREMNRLIAKAGYELGFIVYKAPPWAVEEAKPYLDPGFMALANTVQRTLDPNGVMAPHCWNLEVPPTSSPPLSETTSTEDEE